MIVICTTMAHTEKVTRARISMCLPGILHFVNQAQKGAEKYPKRETQGYNKSNHNTQGSRLLSIEHHGGVGKPAEP